MKRLWEFIANASQNRTVAVLAILVIGASIPLTVLVAQKQQNIQQKASEAMVCDTPPAFVIDSNRQEGLGWNDATCQFEYVNPPTVTISPEPDRGNFVTTPTPATATTPLPSGLTCGDLIDNPTRIAYGCPPVGGTAIPTLAAPTSGPGTPTACNPTYTPWVDSGCGRQGIAIKCEPNQMYQTRSSNQPTGCSGNYAVLEQCVPSSVCGTTMPKTSITPTVASGNITLSIGLDGIGSTGDRSNPNAHSLSNKNPKHPKNINLGINDGSIPVTLNYDSASGKYTGSVPLLGIPISSASTVRIATSGHLAKRVSISSGQTVSADLIGGDINNDNHLTILDYNMLVSCMGSPEPVPTTGKFSTCSSDADINMDGAIDQIDYNLWLREFKTGPRDGD